MSEICISNLVYGESYTSIFLNFHLKSLLENLSANNPFTKSYYLIFTAESNVATIEAHPNYKELKKYLNVFFLKIPDHELTYNARYQIQGTQLTNTAQFAVTNNLLMYMATADHYFGPNFFEKALAYFDQGFDALVHQPIRSTYETAAPSLMGPQITIDELLEIGLNNSHPVWVTENWDSPNFTKYPYQITWSDDRSVCLRGFSLGVTIVVAKDWMTTVGGCTDMTFLPHLTNPYFSKDWSELPMIELCHLISFYPPFSTKRANAKEIADWAKTAVPPDNFKNLSKYIIFKKTTDPVNPELITRSEVIAKEIMAYGGRDVK